MMTAKDYRQQAWQRLSGNWGTMVLAYLIFGVISGVLAYTYVGPVLLGGVLSIGVASVSLSLMRTGTTSLEYLFDGFKYKFGNAVLASLLYNIFIALWSMLFLIPGLVKTYSYAMTYYIMRDNPDMSANDAITASRKMMDGNKARLFGLHFSFFGWILLAGVTCGIGFLFVMPYMQAAQAAFYEDLKRKQIPGNNFYNNQQYAQPQQPYAQQYAQPQQPYAQPQQPYAQQYAQPQQPYAQQYAQPQQPYAQQYAQPQQPYAQQYAQPQQPYGQQFAQPQQPYGQQFAQPQQPAYGAPETNAETNVSGNSQPEQGQN